ncbi:MAG: response regulator [Deltaproteobacteria bacterium]|nr:response regulator [Deltaproteobacteria bacterium]
MTFVPRILIVDDEKRIRSGCVKMLTEDGFSATSAETAEAGLAIIKKEHFDIILLDLMMSGMSGLDALVQLRMLHPDTVVIVITGYATLEYSIEAMKRGAFDFIPKPFSPEDLRRVVQKAVEYIRTLQDIATESSRMRVLINHLSDGVLAVDSQKKIVLANPAVLKLTGYEGSAVIGRQLSDVVTCPDLISSLDQALGMPLEEFREIRGELNGLAVDSGEGTVIGVRCVPFRDRLGRTLGAVLVLHDITALKKIDQLKSHFVSMVAHEIRSPMNTVLAQIHILMDGLAGNVSEKQKEILGRCAEKVTSLAEMTTQLLDLAKIESGLTTGEREKLNLSELLLQQLSFHQDQAAHKKISLSAGPIARNLLVMANPYHLREVVANLLSNAIKYTPDGGCVIVSAIERNSYACIRVSDTGFGISSEDLKLIFNRFYRVKNENTRFIIGTGLGLSIVKSIVEAHQGRVVVESKLGRGSVFSVDLPLLLLEPSPPSAPDLCEKGRL